MCTRKNATRITVRMCDKNIAEWKVAYGIFVYVHFEQKKLKTRERHKKNATKTRLLSHLVAFALPNWICFMEIVGNFVRPPMSKNKRIVHLRRFHEFNNLTYLIDTNLAVLLIALCFFFIVQARWWKYSSVARLLQLIFNHFSIT